MGTDWECDEMSYDNRSIEENGSRVVQMPENIKAKAEVAEASEVNKQIRMISQMLQVLVFVNPVSEIPS